MTTAVVEIDLKAIRENLQRFKQWVAPRAVVAVVKADAYGHGLLPVAQYLAEQADYLGVARLDEAIALRQAGISTPIILLEGFLITDELQLLVDYQLQAVVHAPWQIECLQQAKLSAPLTIWFKLDSGMHRLGFRTDDALDYFQQLAACPQVKLPLNLMSHFCCADELASSATTEQMQAMAQFVQQLPDTKLLGLQSLAASAGLLAWLDSWLDMVRPGLALYGVSPFDWTTPGKGCAQQLGLRAAMTLKSSVITVRRHRAGEAVGYGQIWHATQDTQLAVVALGYGDGYPRQISSGTPVLINGQRYPIVGRVSMDMIVVDIGANQQIAPGDEVIFWGEQLPVEEIAWINQMSAYELITRLTGRAQRRYQG